MPFQAPESLPLAYYSDVLCIHAYVAEAKIAELVAKYGDRVRVNRRFFPSFGDTETKISDAWKEKGGWEGYTRHVREMAAKFPHIEVNPATWAETRPASSHSPHLLLKAIQLAEPERAEAAMWGIRQAFFKDARDVGCWDIQRQVVEETGADISRAEAAIRDGRAFAALSSDYQSAQEDKVAGSPTFLFPEGRQKLYGDVGFRIIDANVSELLRPPSPGNPAWC